MNDAPALDTLVTTPAPASSGAFRPWPGTAGGHRQTLLGYWFRRRLGWPFPSEDRVVDADGEVRLLLRLSVQPRGATERPTLLLVHGLGGSDGSTYALALGRHAWAQGWNVVRMNMRGEGGSEELCARLYHAGVDHDLLAVLVAVAEMTPRVAVAGFSLGANLALLAAARHANRLPPGFLGVAAVSPPVDLAACADTLARPGNRFYQRFYMKGLRAGYARRQRLRPDLYAEGGERGPRTVREWDEAITAPAAGFAGADEYYARSSSGPLLARITCPALVLAAADDPLIPIASVAHWPLPPGGNVTREVTATGGHVGFVGATAAPGSFWAAERVMDWLGSVGGEHRP